MSSRYGNSDYNPLHITSFLFIANDSRMEIKLSKLRREVGENWRRDAKSLCYTSGILDRTGKAMNAQPPVHSVWHVLQGSGH